MKFNENKFRYFTLLLVFIALSGFIPRDQDVYYKMSKSIDVFGKVYKEIILNYVDDVDPEKFMEAGIEGMLTSLDPYTNYIDKDHQKDIDIITKGKYGGIGASIGIRNGKVTVADLIDGYSAQRQGIRIGDVIIKVDSIAINEENYDDLSTFFKGKPGTELRLTVKRNGIKEPIEFNLIREEIELKNLTYADFYPSESNNVYLKLSGFSRTAGEEIKEALNSLSREKEIKSVVLDLRNNPGGLLASAVDVTEKFIGKGKKIVSVKGRNDKNNRVSISNEEPMAGSVKIAVLVNGNSASASEIVAGAIKDHDRGIIVGQKTFGKGLVQTVLPLSFNTSLKLTTAKYYTPSGRCIQKIDYSDKEIVTHSEEIENEEFTTESGRKVISYGGIVPDSSVKKYDISNPILNLLAKGMFFQFASYYFNTNEINSIDEIDRKNLFQEFIKFLDKHHFEYMSESEQLLAALKTAVDKENFNGQIKNMLAELSKEISDSKEENILSKKEEIEYYLLQEFAARIHGKKGRINQSLEKDKQFEVAFNLLNDKASYFRILNISK